MQKVSAALLTFNNENIIRDVLDKLRWCDEIVIVDSGSKDSTLEICREYTSKIFHKEFVGFGEQKDYLVKNCTHKWVLSIDSDEVLTDKLAQSLKKTLSLPEEELVAGYMISRRNVFLGKEFKYGKDSSEKILRLFNKEKAGFTLNSVHEKIVVNEGESVKDIKGGVLLHYTVGNLSDSMKKMDKYAFLKAKDMYADGKKKSWIKTYVTFGFSFMKMYFFRLNFLNGYEGFVWSLLAAEGAVLKYFYLNELLKKQ